MKKYQLILATAAITGLAACSDSVLTDTPKEPESKSKAITFEHALASNSTRSSVLGSGFTVGTQMEVYGFQTTGGVVDQIFDDQIVECQGSTWTYSPLKYWNPVSTYEFYAAYPAGDYAFGADKNFTITNFTVASAIADQVDLMIAEKNTTSPGNTVTLNFNHLLSQVNFYAKIHENMQNVVNGENKGAVSATINSLTITGLKAKGTFTQDGFETSNYNVKGDWNTSGVAYTFPSIPAATVGYTYKKAGTMTTDQGNVVRELLMVPQALNATLTVNYTLKYADGTTTTHSKSVYLQDIKFNTKPVTSWKMNTIYNYVMTLDPSRAIKDDFTDIPVDWDGSNGGGDGEATPGTTLKGPDANGDYTIEVDTDGDGTVDVTYPVVWEDIDGDGNLEGGVDTDGDGHIDNVDGSTDSNTTGNTEVTDGDSTNNPGGKDVILVDTDGDGKPDTQLEKVITSVVGPEDPTQFTGIDYDGSTNGDGAPTPNARLVQDTDGNYFIEVDADEDGTYEDRKPVLWADLDGDGKEEGYIGNIDGDNNNTLDSTNPIWQQITDGNSNNPYGYDVILIDTDNNGTCETQLERTQKVVVTPDPLVFNAIEFNAQVEYWDTTTEGDIDISK